MLCLIEFERLLLLVGNPRALRVEQVRNAAVFETRNNRCATERKKVR
jgi:hypothetical protein